MSASWKFATNLDAGRRERLLATRNFTEVVALIQESAGRVHLEPSWGRDPELKHCVQPIFTLPVSKVAFDAFFNSPVGYRAGYLIHPNQGLLNNLILVESLLERLIAIAQYECLPDLSGIDVRASLLATSCKVWLHEDDFDFDSPTEGLAVEAWLAAAARGESKARWGLCAPEATRIQIKGALLDPLGNEVVPRKKVLRRYELHHFGFS